MSSLPDFPNAAISGNNSSSQPYTHPCHLPLLLCQASTTQCLGHFGDLLFAFPSVSFFKSYHWVHIVPYLNMYNGSPLRKMKFKLLNLAFRAIYHLFFYIPPLSCQTHYPITPASRPPFPPSHFYSLIKNPPPAPIHQ